MKYFHKIVVNISHKISEKVRQIYSFSFNNSGSQMPSPVGTSQPWLSLVTLCIWLCSVTCKIFYPGSFLVCLIDSSLSSFCPLPFLNFIPKCWHHWGLSLSIFSLFGVPSIRKCSCYPELHIPVICDLSSPIFFIFPLLPIPRKSASQFGWVTIWVWLHMSFVVDSKCC